ncbi:DUF3667 domain-containing protein [Rhodanobacter sp. C01]|uniref:DUF3667 domain-containing protein n=1 Tax=Rhodanobacter sp. C01 TaxID=1945856 RepID=UPI000987908A|nr:DUF3667 domain-containing protein [Rhodanobacter sp. C01]OOG51331.1 hypothetical protein B0E50_01045 [Rhodanobacter sp. C01]
MKQLTSYEGLHCANCGASMQGEFCHECGQSIHSVLKPVHSMAEETLETVLHIDGRIVHTLPPLLLKPGFLTLEYFSGRRVRYIAPFRLMFVLCVLSFFVFHLVIDQISSKVAAHGFPLVSVNSNAIENAGSPAQVRKALQKQLDGLQNARATGLLSPNLLDQTNVAAQDLRQKASRRLLELGAAPISAASVAEPLPSVTVKPADTMRAAATVPDDAGQKAIGQESTPVQIAWLPDMVNARLTELARHIQDNRHAVLGDDPLRRQEALQRMIGGVFSTLPPTMFVLIPVFAILLKLFYVFRRRLYMEHLIVALHSHAFIFLSLLLIAVTGMLSTWLRPHAAWTGYAMGLLQTALILWIPTYLLVMQKRIYRQGWPMTVLKFWCVSWCYFGLLGIALLVALVLGVAH